VLFLPLSWVLMASVFVDACLNGPGRIALCWIDYQPGARKTITPMEQTLETKTIDRAPCRSDPFQAPNLRLDRQCLCGLDPAARSCTRQIFRGGSHHAGTRPRRESAGTLTLIEMSLVSAYRGLDT
jgi:hypothetical protein